MRSLRLVPVTLLALCVGLAFLLYGELVAPADGFVLDGAPAAARATTTKPADFVAPPRQDFAETEARPLFMASRRPFVAAQKPVAAAPKAAVALPSLVLVGIIASAEERLALIKPANSSEVRKVGEGETVAGWQIRRIFADHIVVGAGAGEQEIVFPAQRDTPNAPGSVATPDALIRPARRQ